jgi:hypothetical protein
LHPRTSSVGAATCKTRYGARGNEGHGGATSTSLPDLHVHSFCARALVAGARPLPLERTEREAAVQA